MRKTRVLVVDDERYAREELVYLLGQFPSIQIVGEAESGDAAIVQAIQQVPDVIFLDIEMPKMNGIDTAKALLELKKVPLIVFATAYTKFAVDAFRINAVDYLLKPYDEEQLKQTILRLENIIQPAQAVEMSESLGKLAVEEDGVIHYVLPEMILYIYREGNITKVVTKEKTYDVRITLKELENRLYPFSFFRIHKSYLVNLNYVNRLTPWFNGAYELELQGVVELLSVSRNYVKDLRHRLEL